MHISEAGSGKVIDARARFAGIAGAADGAANAYDESKTGEATVLAVVPSLALLSMQVIWFALVASAVQHALARTQNSQ